MKENKREFIEMIDEWFEPLKDKTEQELREFLRREKPVDAGSSHTERVGNSYSILVYNVDLQTLIYRMRWKYSEVALFESKEIEYLMKEYEIDEVQAKAILFANHLALCDQFANEGLEAFKKLLSDVLESAFLNIGDKIISDALNQFRKHSPQAETFVDRIGLSYIDRLKQNVHLFIKTPDVGRPKGTKNKEQKSRDAKELEIRTVIREIIKDSYGLIAVNDLDKIIEGETPRITKSAVAEKLMVSRGTLDNWLTECELDFETLAEEEINKFLSDLKRQQKC